MAFLKSSRPQEERERTMKRQVYQDLGFPAEHLREMLLHLDGEFEIYPLLVYPCKVIDKGGMLRLPRFSRKEVGREREKPLIYLNLGIYGEPRAVRNGVQNYPTVRKVREVEDMVRRWGGFLHTYVDVFSTRDEFEAMFDHSLWRQMRERNTRADGAFPEIYDKIKPEIDPLQFLDEKGSRREKLYQCGNLPGNPGRLAAYSSPNARHPSNTPLVALALAMCRRLLRPRSARVLCTLVLSASPVALPTRMARKPLTRAA